MRHAFVYVLLLFTTLVLLSHASTYPGHVIPCNSCWYNTWNNNTLCPNPGGAPYHQGINYVCDGCCGGCYGPYCNPCWSCTPSCGTQTCVDTSVCKSQTYTQQGPVCPSPPPAPPAASNFAYTGTVQTYTPPLTAVYRIIAAGAQGGANSINTAVSGAPGFYAISYQTLTAGVPIEIVVGQQGTAASGSNGASGGGGTFVYINCSTLLLAAGGGGGSGSTTSSYTGTQLIPAVATSQAASGYDWSGGGGGFGGSNGGGGAWNCGPAGSGGYGFTYMCANGFAGSGTYGGGAAGAVSNNCGTTCQSGGGGGGYSGGGGGVTWDGFYGGFAGGGGGSYDAGGVLNDFFATGTANQTGNGFVTFAAVSSPPPAPPPPPPSPYYVTNFQFDNGGCTTQPCSTPNYVYNGQVLNGFDTYGFSINTQGNLWTTRSNGPVMYTPMPSGSFSVTVQVAVPPQNSMYYTQAGLTLYNGGGGNVPFFVGWDTWDCPSNYVTVPCSLAALELINQNNFTNWGGAPATQPEQYMLFATFPNSSAVTIPPSTASSWLTLRIDWFATNNTAMTYTREYNSTVWFYQGFYQFNSNVPTNIGLVVRSGGSTFPYSVSFRQFRITALNVYSAAPPLMSPPPPSPPLVCGSWTSYNSQTCSPTVVAAYDFTQSDGTVADLTGHGWTMYLSGMSASSQGLQYGISLNAGAGFVLACTSQN